MAADNSSRRGTDWAEARDFWLALFPHRSYERVAEQFGISGTRVRFVARRDNWQEHADEIDRLALEQAKRRIVRSRADRVAKTLGIVDAALDVFDDQLDAKAADAKLADLPHLVKLAELLEGEATDRMSFDELQDALGVVIAIALEFVAKGRRAEFLARVQERLGQIGDDDGQPA